MNHRTLLTYLAGNKHIDIIAQTLPIDLQHSESSYRLNMGLILVIGRNVVVIHLDNVKVKVQDLDEKEKAGKKDVETLISTL